jgi:hypothetical protein
MSLLRSYTALASGTISIPVDTTNATPYPVVVNNIIAGTVTLVGGLVVSPIGTPTTGQRVVITWNAYVTPSGNPITIFGETVPAELAARNFVAECLWDGTGGPWVVNILPDFAGVGIVAADRIAANAVTTAKIADDAVTLAKMAGLAKGNIIYGDASGDPASVNLGAVDANLVVGDTTNGVAVVAMSGDATIAKTGALTIANDAITTVKILDANVTPAKLSASSNKGQFAVQLEFDEAAKIGVIKYQICSTCTIDGIYATVNRVPATDTATVIPKNHGMVAMTGGQIDITTALALGNIISVTPTANNTFTAGEQMTLETSKTTAEACTITVVVCYTVTA